MKKIIAAIMSISLLVAYMPVWVLGAEDESNATTVDVVTLAETEDTIEEMGVDNEIEVPPLPDTTESANTEEEQTVLTEIKEEQTAPTEIKEEQTAPIEEEQTAPMEEEQTAPIEEEQSAPKNEEHRIAESRGIAVKATNTPAASDYKVSGGTIIGLTDAYLGTLSTEDKANIRLVIPEEVNGVKVTAIGDNAFKAGNYAGCKFTFIDLSAATGLTTIGKYAFYANAAMSGSLILHDELVSIGQQAFEGCASLTGGLVLPDSVTTMGTYAFSGCRGMKGTLTLSSGLTTIPNYAFSNAGFTGELIIPDTVTTIKDSAFRQGAAYEGLSGTLKIPASVTTIEKVAFSYQKGITGVDFSESTLTDIAESIFRYGGLKGVLRLPNTVKTINTNSFAGTSLETVYLPKGIETITNNAFNSSSITAIVCDQEDYDKLSNQSFTNKDKLGYPITVSFYDWSNQVLGTKECLFNRPYNLGLNSDGGWRVDKNYKFPVLDNTAWGKNAQAVTPVKETEKVASAALYAIKAYAKAEITYSDNIDQVYDGTPVTLSVTASHPYAKPAKEAGEGDIVFLYGWYWNTISTPSWEIYALDANEYSFTDIRADYAISCTVQVMTCKVVNKKATIIETNKHTFSVDLRRAEPVVTPAHTRVMLKSGGELPTIATAVGDTEGTIKWDDGQMLQSDKREYAWTFTPDKNEEDHYNYKSKTGTSILNVVDEFPTADEVADVITNVPKPEDGKEFTKEEQKTVLEALLQFETLNSESKEAVTGEARDNLYVALAELPQIETAMDVGTTPIKTKSKNELLKCLSLEDVDALLQDETAICGIRMKAEETTPNEENQEIINNVLDGAMLGPAFEINIMRDRAGQSLNITELANPLELVFDIPDSIGNDKDNLEFSIVRVHVEQDGMIGAEVLIDEDDKPNTVTVSSDKFSTFVMAYKEKVGVPPDEPDNPDDPDKPGTPDNPDKPENPDDSDIPDKPEEPENPDKPGGTGDSDDQNKPGADSQDASGKPANLQASNDAGNQDRLRRTEKSDVAKTSDEAPLGLYMLLSAGAVMLFWIQRKLKRHKE